MCTVCTVCGISCKYMFTIVEMKDVALVPVKGVLPHATRLVLVQPPKSMGEWTKRIEKALGEADKATQESLAIGPVTNGDPCRYLADK